MPSASSSPITDQLPHTQQARSSPARPCTFCKPLTSIQWVNIHRFTHCHITPSAPTLPHVRTPCHLTIHAASSLIPSNLPHARPTHNPSPDSSIFHHGKALLTHATPSRSRPNTRHARTHSASQRIPPHALSHTASPCTTPRPSIVSSIMGKSSSRLLTPSRTADTTRRRATPCHPAVCTPSPVSTLSRHRIHTLPSKLTPSHADTARRPHAHILTLQHMALLTPYQLTHSEQAHIMTLFFL